MNKEKLLKLIEDDSRNKESARQGVRYYNYDHDILRNRIFFIDENDVLREDKYASNVKIPHAFFTELVDQKVQYLLANDVKVIAEDEELQKHIDEYYTDELQVTIQELVEGASQKGKEYIFARTNSKDRLCFQISDSLNTFEIKDKEGSTTHIGRYYNIEEVLHIELWDKEEVKIYVQEEGEQLELKEIKPHVLAKGGDGNLLKRSYGTIPFTKMANNRNETTDLEPIKALIDDYDLMAGYLSNNLQDFAEAIYVVKGFRGNNLDKLRMNIKGKKMVGTSEQGGLEVKTVDIPVEARKTKLEIDRQAIYKFGMGFDSSQVGDSSGQITNVTIQSGYSLLNMKCNKAEIRLRPVLNWINEMIISDINRRLGTAFEVNELKVEMERETMVDQKENAEIKKIEEETRLIKIDTLLAIAQRLDDDTVLQLICEEYDLDWEEVKLKIAEQDYLPLLAGDDYEESEEAKELLQ